MGLTTNVSFSGNREIDGLLYGTKWSVPTVTFSFAPPQGNGATALNSAQQVAIREILQSVAAVTNISFSEVAETMTTVGTLRFREASDQGTASAYMPSEHALGGDVYFNPHDYNAPVKGTYAYATFLHETGHTLGLDHGQDGPYALPAERDSLEYSVMTYRSYPGGGLGGYTVCEGSYPRSFMLSDIAALQYMYGADYSTNAGATTYKWSPVTGELTVDGRSAAKSTTNTVFETIWDGGGVDTYDFTAYSSNLRIDLRPGAWTTTSAAQLAELGNGHVARGNIANAYQFKGKSESLIENARGGSSSDWIAGNNTANKLDGGLGNDTLYGLRGKDLLIGGPGSDTFVFNTPLASSNVDRIRDFAHDTDRVRLEDRIFSAIGTKLDDGEFYLGARAHDSTDRIIYDRATGYLSYDADGNKSGGQAGILFAVLTNKPVLDAGDFAIV